MYNIWKSFVNGLCHGIIAGIFLPSVDRFNEDSEHEVSSVERTSTAPLLEENTAETSASGQSQEC